MEVQSQTDESARSRNILIIFACVIGVALIAAYYYFWQPKPVENVQNVVEKPFIHIRMAKPFWPGFMMPTLAAELGYMKEEGIAMEFPDLPNDMDTFDAMKNNLVDVRGALAADYLSRVRKLGKIDSQIVILSDYSYGGDALVARKGAPALNKKIPVKLSGAEDYLFFVPYALDALNISTTSITYVNIPDDGERIEKLIAGEIDYAATYEPFLSKAIASGAKVIFSSADQRGILTDALVFDSRFIAQHPDALVGFTRAYFKAYNYWKANPDEAYTKIAKYYENKEEITEQMKGIVMLGLDDNMEAMSTALGLTSIYGNLQMVQAYEEAANRGTFVEVLRLVYSDAVRKVFRSSGK